MRSVWVPISGAVAQQQKVDAIANNIANANTAGFKKGDVVFKEELAQLSGDVELPSLPRKEWRAKDFYNSQGNQNAYVQVDGTYTNFSQGSLSPTAGPLDLAVDGRGFFEVLTPEGIRYTRKGDFSIGPNGELLTNQGHRILSKYEGGTENFPDAKERFIQLPPGKIEIDLQGTIRINNNAVSKISLVEFQDINALRPMGSSLFSNPDLANRLPDASKSKVYQGHLEQSNVNVIAEMSELIKAQRQFESIQRAIKAYDEMAGKSANEINAF